MVSTSLMVDTSSHPRAQLHRCVERSAYNCSPKRLLVEVDRKPQAACLDSARLHHDAIEIHCDPAVQKGLPRLRQYVLIRITSGDVSEDQLFDACVYRKPHPY